MIFFVSLLHVTIWHPLAIQLLKSSFALPWTPILWESFQLCLQHIHHICLILIVSTPIRIFLALATIVSQYHTIFTSSVNDWRTVLIFWNMFFMNWKGNYIWEPLKKTTLLKYIDLMINCRCLKCTIWWILTYGHICETRM